MNDNGYYLPASAPELDEDHIWRWYGNVERELRDLDLAHAEHASFHEYYREAGLLTGWRRPFFRHHYAYPLHLALKQIFSNRGNVSVLDLGCGTGTQSILFALAGARVVGVDMDEHALGILRKRQVHYEILSGRKLDITLVSGNVFELDLAAHGPFTALYSMFAFNMMQPTVKLIPRLAQYLSTDAVFAVQDGNRIHLYNRFFRRRNVLSRDELARELRAVGFVEIEHVGGYAIPPPFWTVLPRALLTPLDRAFASLEPLTVSYLHLASRRRQ